MKGYVYVLLRSDGKYYIGSTTSLQDRFTKHQNGGVQSTKGFRPVILLGFKEFETYSEARKIEIKLKKSKSKLIIKKFIGS